MLMPGAAASASAAATPAAASAAPAAPTSGPQEPAPRWGAIAAVQQWYGYAFDEPTREAAERTARAQCQRVATRGRECAVRTAFNRQCGALALGNYGEWGAANAPTRELAAQAAAHQCNEHLPTEPCKVTVQVCSAAP